MKNSFTAGGKILFGSDHLSTLLEDKNRVFVASDPFLVSSGGIEYLTSRLNSLSLTYQVYHKIQPDPDIGIITDGVMAIKEFQPDVIIAIGGGSAIDACKGMYYFAVQQDYLAKVPFVAIPTTSGTGSEVTSFSVITDEKSQLKYPLIDDMVLPDYAILDANLTLTVPPSITAFTGMDVLTHAIEAYVSLNANHFTDALAEKAMKLIKQNLLQCYQKPEDFSAREAMHHASCLAGIAFNNAGLGLNHGMAHALGGKFHLPHGMLNAMIMPHVIGFNAKEAAKAYSDIAEFLGVSVAHDVSGSLFNLLRYIKNLNGAVGIPKALKDLEIDEKEYLAAVPTMANAAIKDSCTATNPRICSQEEIIHLYHQVFYGRSIV